MAHHHDHSSVRDQVAELVHSPLWRSVHLAAPPLSRSLDPEELAALAEPDPRDARTQLEFYQDIAATVRDHCSAAVSHLGHPSTRLSHDDQAWLKARLEALSRRFRESVPPHDEPDVARAAVTRLRASLRHDVDAHDPLPDSTYGFIVRSFANFSSMMREQRPLNSYFLWHEFVAILYIDIDMAAWASFCHGGPWESFYEAGHLCNDMRDDLRRIQARRDALQQQHSLAKPEFVPVARRNGMAF